MLLTFLVLSEGGQDTHFSFEAATVILEGAFSFPSHLKHTVLDQYTHCCSYEINQIKKFSQVTTSHLFLTWSSHCIDTGTELTPQPRQKWNAGQESFVGKCSSQTPPGVGAHPQAYTAHPKTSSAGSAVRIGQIAHRKAERRIKGRVGDGEEILWKRKPHEKCFLVLPTTV